MIAERGKACAGRLVGGYTLRHVDVIEFRARASLVGPRPGAGKVGLWSS
jgi:hypothetical protein